MTILTQNKTQVKQLPDFTVLDWKSCPGCGKAEDTYDDIPYVTCGCGNADGIEWREEWNKWLVHIDGRSIQNCPCSDIADAINLYQREKSYNERKRYNNYMKHKRPSAADIAREHGATHQDALKSSRFYKVDRSQVMVATIDDGQMSEWKASQHSYVPEWAKIL
jgi:hypothetical protein